jgi:hypothetical protein
MELWVRSQDKMNLVKIRQISLNYQNNKQIIANYMPDFYPNSGEYYELLGIYESKERALEVLTEIQNKINLINLGHDFGSPMIDLKNPTYIYQMPEK